VLSARLTERSPKSALLNICLTLSDRLAEELGGGRNLIRIGLLQVLLLAQNGNALFAEQLRGSLGQVVDVTCEKADGDV